MSGYNSIYEIMDIRVEFTIKNIICIICTFCVMYPLYQQNL